MARSNFAGHYGHNAQIELWMDQVSQDIAANTSTVKAAVYFITNQYASMWWTYPKTISLTVDGQSASISVENFSIKENQYLLVGERTFTVTHDTAGKKTVSGSAYIDLELGEYGYTTGSVSGSLKLTDIKRASDFSLSDGTIGTALKINISRADNAYIHKVMWKYGTKQGVISESVATETTWTPPMSLCNANPNYAWNWLMITVETYYKGSLIGSKWKEVKLHIPTTVLPQIGGIKLTEKDAGVMSLMLGDGYMVSGISKIKAELTGVSGAYGSTIVDQDITVLWPGTNLKNPWKYNALPVEMEPFGKGQTTFTANARDSRGRKAKSEKRVEILDYFKPVIKIDAKRVGSTASQIEVQRTAKIAPLMVSGKQKNHMKITYKYRKEGESTWHTDQLNDSSTNVQIEGEKIILKSTYAADKTWVIRAEMRDALSLTTVEVKVGPEKVSFSYDENGIGAGKVRQRGALDVGGDAYVDGSWMNSNGFPVQEWKLTEKNGSAIEKKQIDVGSITDPGFYYVFAVTGIPKGAPIGGFYELKKRNNTKAEILHTTVDNKLYIRADGINNKWEKIVSVKTGEKYSDISNIGAIIQSTEITKDVTRLWTDNMKIMLPPGRYLVFLGYKIEGSGKYLDYELKGTNIANTLYSGDKWEHDSMASGIVDVPGPGVKEFVARSWSSSTTSVKRCYLHAMTIARNTYVNGTLA